MWYIITNYGSIVKTSEKRPTSLQGPKDMFPMWSLFGGFTVHLSLRPVPSPHLSTDVHSYNDCGIIIAILSNDIVIRLIGILIGTLNVISGGDHMHVHACAFQLNYYLISKSFKLNNENLGMAY